MSDEKEKSPCPDCNDTKRVDRLHRATGEMHRITCPCSIELPIKFVFQPEFSGCGVAALAMVTGKTYMEARQYFTLERDFSDTGMYDNEMDEALFALGFAIVRYRPYVARLGGAKPAKWPIEPVSNLAIVQVRNLRDSAWHYVVMLRDGRVLDPYFGVVQGLHRYPEIVAITAIYRVPEKIA